MKKWSLSLLTLVLVVVLAACGNNNANTNDQASNGSTTESVKLVVGATVPHADILRSIIPALQAEGIELEVKEYTDYIQPNVQLAEKQLDANFFQHQQYLDDQNAKNGSDLVAVANIHIEPFGAYSKKYTSADEIADGAKVAIPNDATNGGRALLLLQQQGLIKLKKDAGFEATKKDVVENPKNLQFIEVDAAMLPRQLDEVNLALINTNFALQAGLNPTENALFMEDKNSPYINVLVTRQDNKDSEAIQKLIEALTSDEVRTFIEETYEGALVPVF